MKCTHVIAAAVALVASVTVFSCADSVDNPVEKAAKIRTSKNETVVAAVKNIATAKKELETSGGFGTLTLNFEGSISVEEFESLRSALRELNDVRDENGNIIQTNYIKVILDFSKAELPDNSIPNDGLKNCRKVGGILLPDSVKKIGDWALNECGQELTGPTEFKMGVYDKSTKMPVYGVLPPKLTEIGDCAFGWCSRLVSITIPDGVKTLTGTFIGCDRLNSVIIGKGVTALKDFPESDPAKGNFGVFEGCESLIPGSVHYAGTMEDWKKVTKDEKTLSAAWYSPYPAPQLDNTISCEDGYTKFIVYFTLSKTSVSLTQGETATITIIPTNASATTGYTLQDMSDYANNNDRIAKATLSGTTITITTGWVAGSVRIGVKNSNNEEMDFTVNVIPADISTITTYLTIGTAESSNPADYQVANLSDSKPAEYFKVNLEANKNYRFQLVDSDHDYGTGLASGDCFFFLYDSSFNMLTFSDSRYINRFINASGTYYFGIARYSEGNNRKGAVHVYTTD